MPTPVLALRLDPAVRAAAQKAADRNGLTLSDFIRDALADKLAEPKTPPRKPPR